MKFSKHDKVLLFEQELATLFFILVFAFTFRSFAYYEFFYLVTFTLGFLFYFWMMYEEGVHTTGQKHQYFDHTSSFIMLGQTALALQLVCLLLHNQFLTSLFLIISVVMYSVALARVVLFKAVFKR